jgi:SAM-dependent methyltransferase
VSDEDDDLLAEQVDFYRVDAESFDAWVSSLLDEANDDPAAREYRAGRERLAAHLAAWAPLGRVLEIGAGGGHLAPLYLPHASSAVLLDSSTESLRLARRRLGAAVEAVAADVFDWSARPGTTFDTVVFVAWLHHVPQARFGGFWAAVDRLLAPGGRVLFDFPDDQGPSPARTEVPAEPSEEYGFYAPSGGISLRDHFGRRWRVVHHLWDPDQLRVRLAELGWAMTVLGRGLFGNVHWAVAERR